MIDDGLFDRFPVAEVYALHNSSALEPGKIALNYGAMQAAADAFTITVKGKGGHASRPQMNHDPVLAAAHVIVALQSIVSREVDPLGNRCGFMLLAPGGRPESAERLSGNLPDCRNRQNLLT